MNKNQAFTILQKSGGVKAARLITDNIKNISGLRVHWVAYQLRRGVPIAKIIHEKWFFGEKFYTNKWTLDPRPDSETLVEAVIAAKSFDAPIRILDLGTGTGCLIAALVKNIPGATGVGIDKSRHAIHVARRNVSALGLFNQILILHRSFDSMRSIGKFDIIVSNPPYIARGDTRVDMGAMHDPKVALYASHDGLAAYETIAKRAKDWIRSNGKIYLEIGAGQGDAVRDIFINAGWRFTRSFNDLTDTERVLCFSYNNS